MNRFESNPRIVIRLQNLSRLAAVVVIAVGCLDIVNWLFNIEILRSVMPGLATMKFNAALAFVLSGIGLLNLCRRPRIAQIAAFIVFLLGLFTLGEYLFNGNFGLDQGLVQDTAASQYAYPGRMSPVTALTFSLIGVSMLVFVRSRRIVVAQLLALAATFIALISLAGYIYNEQSLYQISIFSSMALLTTLSFIIIGIGVVFARPENGLTAVIVTDGAGGVLIRRLLPTAIVIPLVLGWLWQKGLEAGLYDTNFGLAIVAVSNISVFTLIVFWNANSLNPMDVERSKALDALRQMNEQLESLVQDRTAELKQANQILNQEIIERERTQALYRMLVEHLPETAVIMFNHEKRYTVADGPILKATGYSKDHMLGKTIFEVLPLASQQALLPLYERVLQGEAFQFERQSAGLYYNSNFVPIYDVDGTISNGLIVVQDVTRRKQAEESLAELAAIVQSTDDAIISKRLDGTITSWNFGAERVFGYTASEMVGHSIELLFPPDRQSEESSIIAKLMRGELIEQFESVRVTKDERHIPVSLTISLMKDANGQVIGVSNIARDITERKRVEDDLRMNKEKLQTIFELLPVGASLMNSDRHVFQINSTLEKIMDISMPDLLTGKYRSRQYIHSDGTSILPTEFPSERAFIEQQPIYDVEIGVIKEDGITIWTSVNAAPLPDNQGVVIVTRDITERKRYEMEMQRLQIVLDRMVEGAQIIDFDWHYIYLNDAAAAQGLRTKKDLLGSTMMEMYPGIEQSSLFGVMKRCMQQRVTEHIENPFTFPDNTIGWFELSIQPVPEGIFILSTDISERKRAEDIIKHDERLLRTILEILPIGVLIIDSTGTITQSNPAAQQIWEGVRFVGVEDYGEYKGWWVDTGMLIQPEEWAAARAIMKGETSLNEEVEIECFDGSHKFILNYAIPMRDQQQTIIGVVVVNHDITKIKSDEIALQRINEQLQQANKEIERFAYIVSHDLRAPLINLKGFSELLQVSVEQIDSVFKSVAPLLDEAQIATLNTAIHEKIPTSLRFINTSVDRMDGFTSAILKLSRLENRQLNYEVVNLKDLVSRILQSLAMQITEQSVEIVVDELPEIQADRIALDQILGNIISNAINYLDPDRRGQIRIYSERDDEKLTIHVQDNGRGIAEVDYDKIFAPFRRAGRSAIEGQGMGLAYVQALIKRHHGKIWFNSTPNRGTTFSFTIPNSRV